MIPHSITLADDMLTLRPMRVADARNVVEAVQESVDEIMPWLSWCTPTYDLATATTWLESLPQAWSAGIQYAFAITDTTTGRFLGSTGLNHINHIHRLANLGYWVRTSATHRGVASRAARMVARFGFEQLGLLRAEIVVSVGNHPIIVAGTNLLKIAHNLGGNGNGLVTIPQHQLFQATIHKFTPGKLRCFQM